MKFTTLIQKTTAFTTAIIGFYFLTSCGSYHYVGMYDDGIYGNSEAAEYNSTYQREVPENEVGNSYYKDYFKGKADEFTNSQDDVFTDIDNYKSNYDSQNESEENYAGWGQNSDSNVIINIQSRPNYGMVWGWNSWGWNAGWNNWGWNAGWNNWGWNAGWNNWGYPSYGFWDPFYFNNWNMPFWGGYGFIQPYYGQNIAYLNGYRNSGYRTNSISNRSVLGTVSRVRSKNTRATATRSRSYNNSRPTRTSTTTRAVRASNGNVTTTRSTRATVQQPTRSASKSTRQTIKPSSRSNGQSRSSTINSSRSAPRSSSYSRSMSAPSAPRMSGSRSRSGGGSIRQKRN